MMNEIATVVVHVFLGLAVAVLGAVVAAHASGLTPSVPMAQAAVYAQAIDLARRWGGHRVVALRLEVAS